MWEKQVRARDSARPFRRTGAVVARRPYDRLRRASKGRTASRGPGPGPSGDKTKPSGPKHTKSPTHRPAIGTLTPGRRRGPAPFAARQGSERASRRSRSGGRRQLPRRAARDQHRIYSSRRAWGPAGVTAVELVSCNGTPTRPAAAIQPRGSPFDPPQGREVAVPSGPVGGGGTPTAPVGFAGPVIDKKGGKQDDAVSVEGWRRGCALPGAQGVKTMWLWVERFQGAQESRRARTGGQSLRKTKPRPKRSLFRQQTVGVGEVRKPAPRQAGSSVVFHPTLAGGIMPAVTGKPSQGRNPRRSARAWEKPPPTGSRGPAGADPGPPGSTLGDQAGLAWALG